MSLPPKDSPVWGIFYLLIIAGALYFNANNFDETEIKALLEITCILMGGDFIRSRAGK